jgi:hypothetical protein
MQSDLDPCCSLTNPITSRETDSNRQAGLDQRWSQTHYVGFVMMRLKCVKLQYCSKKQRTCLTNSTIRLFMKKVERISQKAAWPGSIQVVKSDQVSIPVG